MRTLMAEIGLLALVTWGGCVDYRALPGAGRGPLDADGDAGIGDGADDGDGAGDDDGDRPGDVDLPDCDAFITALAECPYQLVTEIQPEACPRAVCMAAPCRTDADCPLAGASDNGGSCVMGNCVYCWQDTDCPPGHACRGGRCVDVAANPCGNAPPCQAPRCGLVSISEQPCPVCVCDSIFDVACQRDLDCQVISSHPYRRCVYGRCADCKDDSECGYGPCLPPGVCFDMQPHPEALYGAWLIGWWGGMDHFSYFRFEPDGTFRRGFYGDGGVWADDIPGPPCWPGEPWPAPQVGTWEPVESESGLLIVRLSLNVACDDGAGWSERYAVGLPADTPFVSFQHLDGESHYEGWQVPMSACGPDFTECQVPADFWP